jgi:hypothetical protein
MARAQRSLGVALVAAVAAAVVAAPRPARAYEFWLTARTVGQLYQLRSFRLLGPDLFLSRRRFTQTLALRIWDVGDLAADRRRARRPERGLRISWQSYLRLDHDFGSYAAGQITQGSIRRDALDVIPELADQTVALELMYGYLQLDGLLDDRLTVRLGRILADDSAAPVAFDGAAARVELPAAPLAVSASAGLRVRASSPLGVSSYELDGTSGAGCREYVEGPQPGTGSWQLIDRNRVVTNNRLASDYELCPQRDVRQPTIGVALGTARLAHVSAEVGYRRTSSATVGLIGAPDRLTYPDLGLYPNEAGQAPASGVNEERLYATVHGDLRLGPATLAPYGLVRYSLLHGAIDRAPPPPDAGVRIRLGRHVLEPSVGYFLPTFDGDSIFNAFSIEPTTDARLGYQLDGAGPWRGWASAWLRRYQHEDSTTSLAGGGEASLERAVATDWRGRLDALWDDGYGGRRIGGTGEVGWRAERGMWLRGRLIVLGVRRDDRPARDLVTTSGQLSATWRVAEGVALHALAETAHDAALATSVRVLGVLDLAFLPEP